MLLNSSIVFEKNGEKYTYESGPPERLGLFWFSKSFVTTASKIKDLTSSSLPIEKQKNIVPREFQH